MLESELTMYQLMDSLSQKEYLQRIINLLNSDKEVCNIFDKVLNKLEEKCAKSDITLAEVYPDYEKIETVF